MSSTSPRILIDLSVAPPGGAGTYAAGFLSGLVEADLADRDRLVVVVDEAWASGHADMLRAVEQTRHHRRFLPGSRRPAPGRPASAGAGRCGPSPSATTSTWPTSRGMWRLGCANPW